MNTSTVLKNIRKFKYKGIKYVIAETREKIDSFYGAYKQKGNKRLCIVNSFLPGYKKQLVLHNLIKNKKCRCK